MGRTHQKRLLVLAVLWIVGMISLFISPIRAQSGSIRGTKFNDLNDDGQRASWEPGIFGWVIELHRDSSASVQTARTDIHGDYVLENLSSGSYTVIEQPQAGWRQTFPAAGSYALSIPAGGRDFAGIDFGNTQSPRSISGTKFEDRNADGRNENEPGLNGWVIVLHQDTISGLEVARTTTATTNNHPGSYSFTNLAPGKYVVSEISQTGWNQSWPSSPGYCNVRLTATGPSSISKDFGNYGFGSLSGRKFKDLDGDCSQNLPGGEVGLKDWIIRLDAVLPLDPTPRYTTTDGNGDYHFNYLPPGTYTISEQRKSNWQRTCPPQGVWQIALQAGQNLTGFHFANRALNQVLDLAVFAVGDPPPRPGRLKKDRKSVV